MRSCRPQTTSVGTRTLPSMPGKAGSYMYGRKHIRISIVRPASRTPPTDADANQVDRSRRHPQAVEEPVVEDRLVLDRADPLWTFGVTVARVRRRVDGRAAGQRVVRSQPTLMTLDAVQHEQRRPSPALQQPQLCPADGRLLRRVALGELRHHAWLLRGRWYAGPNFVSRRNFHRVGAFSQTVA